MSRKSSKKLAIIGLGHIADYQLEALKSSDDFELVAACDKDISKRTKLPDTTPFFTEPELLLSESDADAVLIATNYTEHLNLALGTLAYGKNVLLEKPVAGSKKEFDELFEAARNSNNNILVSALHAAFAKDLLWFKNVYNNSLKSELGSLTGFHCRFYDPYLHNGTVNQKMLRFGGSWMDSGINALSAVAEVIPIESLKIIDSEFIEIPQASWGDMQATVSFSFPIGKNDGIGKGAIETSWMLGVDLKTTTLYFDETKHEVILHHSKQHVVLIDDKKNPKILADFSENGERLINHYKGVFDFFAFCLKNKTDNLCHSKQLHELLFQAYHPCRAK